MSSTKEARVFQVAPHSRYNTEGAKEFGEIVYLMEDIRISPLRPEELISVIFRRLAELEYDPDIDFVVLTGGQYLVIIMSDCISYLYGSYKALLFDAHAGGYVCRHLNFKHGSNKASSRTKRTD